MLVHPFRVGGILALLLVSSCCIFGRNCYNYVQVEIAASNPSKVNGGDRLVLDVVNIPDRRTDPNYSEILDCSARRWFHRLPEDPNSFVKGRWQRRSSGPDTVRVEDRGTVATFVIRNGHVDTSLNPNWEDKYLGYDRKKQTGYIVVFAKFAEAAERDDRGHKLVFNPDDLNGTKRIIVKVYEGQIGR